MELANERRRYRAPGWRDHGFALWLLLVGAPLAALLAAVAGATAPLWLATGVNQAVLYGDLALAMGWQAAQGVAVHAAKALLSTLLVWVPFLLLEVVAHEMGHLLAGKLVGFRFVFCTIGPFKFTSTGRGLALGYNENWMTVAGSAASIPEHPRHARQRELARIAGGPIASLLLGGMALALAASTGGLPHRLCELAAITSLFSFGANMLPFKSGGSLSDGARIKMLLSSKGAGDRYCAIVALVGASKRGQRPRDWNHEWSTRATGLADGSLDDIAGNHLAYYAAVDANDMAGAEAHMERALAASEGAHIPHRVRWTILVDAAFFLAYFRGDAPTARALLTAAGDARTSHDRFIQLRAEAAALLAEGKLAQAQAIAAEGLAALEQARPSCTGSQLEREWLLALAQPAEQQAA
ncbi:MAG: hypothetical protein ACJ78Q_11785 [Chloroflexia bacterium]